VRRVLPLPAPKHAAEELLIDLALIELQRQREIGAARRAVKRNAL